MYISELSNSYIRHNCTECPGGSPPIGETDGEKDDLAVECSEGRLLVAFDDGDLLVYYDRRSEFNGLVSADSDDDIAVAALFLFLNRHCFNGLYRVNRKGLFNVPFNGSKSGSFSPDTVIIFAILLMIFGYYIMLVIGKTMFLSVMGKSIGDENRYHKQPKLMHWPESKYRRLRDKATITHHTNATENTINLQPYTSPPQHMRKTTNRNRLLNSIIIILFIKNAINLKEYFRFY